MNKFISNKKTVLAIVLSVVMISTLGTLVTASAQSENSTQDTLVKIPTIQGTIDINKILMSSVKTSFVEAATTAASSVSGGHVMGGELGPDQGYYVYNFRVLDSDSKMHFVTVDAGNGKVLSNTEGFGTDGKQIFYRFQAAPVGNTFSGNMEYSTPGIAIGTVTPPK